MTGDTAHSPTAPTLGDSEPSLQSANELSRGSWRRGLIIALLTLFALLPTGLVLGHATMESRNIVYWDEIDTVLDLLIKLDDGLDVRGFFDRIFAVNNEHRMLTSRLMFVASWWLTGTVDFRVLGAIGNAFLLALCLTLVWAARTPERRLRLGLVLAFVMFQLEHYENLLWSGASIDHFQVVALAIGAIVALTRVGKFPFALACTLAALATFTLAHGLVTWGVGILLLWQQRRWRALCAWSALAAAAAATFFSGYEVNAAHPMAEFDPPGVLHMARYWLALLGAPAALGFTDAAPYAGALFLAFAGWLAWRRAWHHERIALAAVGFCLGALMLVAVGRSAVDGGVLHSRYMVLAGLAWALAIFVALERATSADRPFRVVVAVLPALLAFNIVANLRFAPAAETFLEHRDRAALRFKQHGRDGTSFFKLYPNAERGSQILQESARRGLYWIPRMCVRVDIPHAQPSGRIAYFIDEMTADTRAVYISGWAAIPKEISRRGSIHLVFRSPTSSLIYTTVAMSRPDVAAATSNPQWRLSGFRFAVGRWRLPPEELQLGILIKQGERAELIMTEHRLRPYGKGEAILAQGD
jgi:hypothetical protein